jgi:hydrogenase small subunit
MSPFYDRLPHVDTEGLEFTADRLGLTIVAATAAGFALHGVGKAVQHRVGAARDARAARSAAAPDLGTSSGQPMTLDGQGHTTDSGGTGGTESSGHYGFDSEPDGR